MAAKVIFITDGDSPSGQALIRHYAQEGDFLLIRCSPEADMDQALDSCEAVGSKALLVRMDLCHSDEVDRALEQAEQTLGPIDAMIHNPRKVDPIRVEDGDEAAFLSAIQVHAKSAFICTQAVGRLMAARGSGKIVYVGSLHSEKPTGGAFAYSVSQGAIKMLSREAALTLGRFGIQVNYIEWGPVEGDHLTFQSSLSTLYDAYQYKVPNAVLGSYDDLAQVVSFLTSDAATFVNGADIRVDGGFLLHYLDHKMKKPPDGGGVIEA